MSPLNNLTARVSIDGLGISCFQNCSETVFLVNELGGYKREQCFRLDTQRSKNNSQKVDLRGLHYVWRFRYVHTDTGNNLDVYTSKIQNAQFVPSVYAFFYSSYHSPLSYNDVKTAIIDLCQTELVDFHLSKIHLAADLIVPDKIELHRSVSRSINPLKKQWIKNIKGTLYLGAPISSNQVVAYNKGRQLEEVKGVIIDGEISRIEVRMRMSLLRNCIDSLEDLRWEGWASFIYGRYFSLDYPRIPLISLLGKKSEKMPIRKIKALLKQRYGHLPSNFHRDYVREHRRLGPTVRNALNNFYWS